MRLVLLALALLTGASAQTYPGTPIITIAGISPSLSCGARLLSATQVQTYCFFLNPPAPAVLTCNHVDTIQPSSPPLTVLAQGFEACQATQLASMAPGTSGQVYWVDWMIWQPDPSGPVQYQIGFGQWSCTMNTSGECELTDGTNGGKSISGHF